MNFNWQAPPLSKSSDYEKLKRTQDELIALQIANDANIANARKAVLLNIPPQLSIVENMSPEESLSDNSRQESLAQQNLKQFKFRDQDISDILVQIRRDPQLSYNLLNANFPAIKSNVERSFDTKLITPTFFVEYLKTFLQKRAQSVGLVQMQPSINNVIDTVFEVKLIVPNETDMEYIKEQALKSGILNGDNLERFNEILQYIPSQQDYEVLSNMDQVSRKEAIDFLLDIFKNFPTSIQIESLVNNIKNGRLSRREFYDSINKLLNSIDNILPRLPKFEQKEENQIQNQTPVVENQIVIYEPKLRRDVYKSTSTSKLGDIKQFLNENPDIADALINRTTGRRIKPSTLTKKPNARGGNFIDDTNLEDIWNREANQSNETKTGNGFVGDFNRIQKQSKNRMKIGSGLKAVQIPTYREFGKFCINTNQLEQQDILNVKYKNCLGVIPQFKPIAVSDILKDFIMNLLDTGKANIRVYSQISDEERKYFEKIATSAGVFNHLGLPKTIIDDEEKDVKRWEILRGQAIAGNNNKMLLEELRKLTVKLMNCGKIRRKEGIDILLELSAM
jgi:hypothetical protein